MGRGAGHVCRRAKRERMRQGLSRRSASAGASPIVGAGAARGGTGKGR
ncbi:hypothetical protein HMPREF9946_03446, partial [Acetobacteraceae bacterium AT-5844]